MGRGIRGRKAGGAGGRPARGWRGGGVPLRVHGRTLRFTDGGLVRTGPRRFGSRWFVVDGAAGGGISQTLDKNERKWQSEYEGTIILIVFERSNKFRNGDIAWQMGDM